MQDANNNNPNEKESTLKKKTKIKLSWCRFRRRDRDGNAAEGFNLISLSSYQLLFNEFSISSFSSPDIVFVVLSCTVSSSFIKIKFLKKLHCNQVTRA